MPPEIDWTDTEAIIRAELEPGETLLWSGRPRQGLVLRAGDLRQIVSCIFVFGFVTFLFMGNNRKNGPAIPPFILFAGPILLYNAILIFARPALDLRFRSRMAYGLTSDRVLFVARRFGHRVKSLELDSMVDVKLQSHGHFGGGVIRFGNDAGKPEPVKRPANWMVVREMNSFELDRDAATVYHLVQQALRVQSRARDRSVVVREVVGKATESWEQPDDAIRPELQPREILLWAGRPRLGFVPNWLEMISMLGTFLWMIYFHLVFAGGMQQVGFAFFWVIFGIKMLAVASKVGRAVSDASLRARTAYGVTTTRAVIVTGGTVRRVRSLALAILAEADLTQRDESDGGTILIGPDVPRTGIQANVALMGGVPSHMLRFVLAQDARLVYRLLRRARRPADQGV